MQLSHELTTERDSESGYERERVAARNFDNSKPQTPPQKTSSPSAPPKAAKLQHQQALSSGERQRVVQRLASINEGQRFPIFRHYPVISVHQWLKKMSKDSRPFASIRG
jgi:hypothetical protein